MGDSQRRFEEALRKVAADTEVDLAFDYGYSNTGVWRFYLPDTLDLIAECHFNFQSGYATFQAPEQASAPTPLARTRHYAKVPDWQGVLDEIGRELRRLTAAAYQAEADAR